MTSFPQELYPAIIIKVENHPPEYHHAHGSISHQLKDELKLIETLRGIYFKTLKSTEKFAYPNF